MSNMVKTVDQDRARELEGLAPPPTKIGTVRRDLERMQHEFKRVLPKHVSPEQFIRVTTTALQSNPSLLDCDRRSLFSAAMRCAQDGLLPDGRLAAFVPFKGHVQYIPMVAGILKKIRNSGELLSISAHVAYENDKFYYCLGDDEKIEHVPTQQERGKPVLGYAIARTKDGGIYREVMTVADIERIRQNSRAANNGPWVTHWEEMARKTVVRRLSKYLPMSTDIDDITILKNDDEFNDSRPPKDDPSGKIAEQLDQIESFAPPNLIEPPEQPEPAKAETAAVPATATREETGAGAADQSLAPDGGREWDMLKGYEPTNEAKKVAAAMQAGWDAHEAKLARKAVPGELRDKGREAEAQAWYSGWDRRAQEH